MAKSGRAATATGRSSDKRTLYEAAAWAERQFCECLANAAEAEPARRYLAERGINAASCSAFHLGYSPDRWQWLLDRARSTSYSPAVLEAAGLAAKSSESGRFYDFFRGRVLFSIRDPQNRPIGFGGRILPGQDDPRKYVNTRETRLFSKSEHVYGLDLARDAIARSRQVVVVEGYTDVIMAHQCGLTNFVAVLGTALGPRHIRLLRRYADSITLLLDGDEAGQRRTNEVLELFVQSDVDLRVLTLPDGLDPCDFLLQRGAEAMRGQLSGAVDALEHAIRVQTKGIDLLRDTHRANRRWNRSSESWPRRRVSAARRRRPSSSANGRCWRGWPASSRLRKRSSRTRIADLRRELPVKSARRDAAPAVAPVSVQDLGPYDAELLEILVRSPELVGTAVQAAVGRTVDQRGGAGHSADVSRGWSRAASQPISGRCWPNWRIRN